MWWVLLFVFIYISYSLYIVIYAYVILIHASLNSSLHQLFKKYNDNSNAK